MLRKDQCDVMNINGSFKFRQVPIKLIQNLITQKRV